MRIELSRGGICAAVETHGGELVSFLDSEGTEYIWGGDPAYWAGQNPILFPTIGAVKDGVTRFRGVEYPLQRHGFARHSEFAPVEQGTDYVVLELRESPETLAQYPYSFRLRVTHRLLENGFETAFAVKNMGKEEMPFCLGGHTAYRCPLRAGETFEDYRLVFDTPERADTIHCLPDGILHRDGREAVLQDRDTIALHHEIFDRLDTLIFDGLRSKGVSLVHQDTGRGLRVEYGDFPMIAFWTMPDKNAPYICIEPWHGCGAYDDDTGNFEDKLHCIRLAPGEEKHLHFSMYVR